VVRRSPLLLAVLSFAFWAGVARAQAALPESLADVSPEQRAKLAPLAVPARVLVQLDSAALRALPLVDRSPRHAEIARLQGRVMPDLPAADFAIAYVYESLPALAGTVRSERALARLAARAEVVRVYPSLDARFDLLASVAQIHANARHAKGNLGAGVVVAVLDSGVDTDHPDLADSIVGQECFLSGGGCPGGGTRQSGPGAAEDDVGHGTHVAGIVTSNGVVSDGPGVAPAADVLAMKIGTSSGITTADWVAALDFILSHPALGVKVVNMSFGTTMFFSASDCDGADPVASGAVSTLRAAGVITFAASGNQSKANGLGLPACFHDVVSVGSVSAADAISTFTNSAPILDVLAPGEAIDSSYLGGGHAVLSGTSMASPHAAGCAALLIQAGDATTPDQIEARLESSPVRPTDPDNGLAFPRIDCSPLAPLSLFPYVR
jgi:subtilisin family serine protease